MVKEVMEYLDVEKNCVKLERHTNQSVALFSNGKIYESKDGITFEEECDRLYGYHVSALTYDSGCQKFIIAAYSDSGSTANPIFLVRDLFTSNWGVIFLNDYFDNVPSKIVDMVSPNQDFNMTTELILYILCKDGTVIIYTAALGKGRVVREYKLSMDSFYTHEAFADTYGMLRESNEYYKRYPYAKYGVCSNLIFTEDETNIHRSNLKSTMHNNPTYDRIYHTYDYCIGYRRLTPDRYRDYDHRYCHQFILHTTDHNVIVFNHLTMICEPIYGTILDYSLIKDANIDTRIYDILTYPINMYEHDLFALGIMSNIVFGIEPFSYKVIPLLKLSDKMKGVTLTKIRYIKDEIVIFYERNGKEFTSKSPVNKRIQDAILKYRKSKSEVDYVH